MARRRDFPQQSTADHFLMNRRVGTRQDAREPGSHLRCQAGKSAVPGIGGVRWKRTLVSSAADFEHRVPPACDYADPNRLMEFILHAAERSKHVVPRTAI